MGEVKKEWEVIKEVGEGARLIVVTTQCDGVSDICEVNKGMMDCDDIANLLASAPDLLEQLKELLKFTECVMENTGCSPGDNQEYLILDCHRAIGKARGES